jgi:hypothetical protein
MGCAQKCCFGTWHPKWVALLIYGVAGPSKVVAPLVGARLSSQKTRRTRCNGWPCLEGGVPCYTLSM